jgi:hypothetical protein
VIEAYLLLGWLTWAPPRWSWRGPRSHSHVRLLLPGPSGLWGLHSVEWEWETDLTCRDPEGQLIFPCPLWPHCRQGSGSGQGKGHFFDQCLVWLHLKQAPVGVHCCLEVGRSSLRAAVKSWAFHWFQASSQLLNTLTAIFTSSPWGGLRTTLCLFKFSLNIREWMGNKMRVENNWIRYLNSLILEAESLEKESNLFSIWESDQSWKRTHELW